MQFQYENSFEVKEKIMAKKVAILPIGAVEAHGPHLPLGTDNLLAERLSAKLAERINGFVLPTLPYGQVWSLKNFPGSINVSNESLISMLYDIGESLYRQGFQIFAMVNGHLGNAVAMKEAARKLYEKYPGLTVLYLFYPGTGKIISEVRETPASHGTYFHADEIETSYMLYLAPEFVQMEKALNDMPTIPMSADVTPTPWEEFTETAVLSDATLARVDKGEKIIKVALDNMVQLIEQMKEGR
ncbi:creatininase family protein [Robertmurraya sp. DFI.2.37]|jgi:creatinine amidohydrolase|uniref:creatininase family protein n=1 Tax=Robertmurraya sp. DFI.2.37 TaxID=3031819 RepID=UPI000BA68D96|nr:creatininase family protein [Robertmurraya sp. DFI.2.37]MDF1508123.1 creatininase family protein [Robertmurraya sp. DFI.2.37]PAE18764.1 creatinine amidohydrolase [Bacillus sp. 7504-2]